MDTISNMLECVSLKKDYAQLLEPDLQAIVRTYAIMYNGGEFDMILFPNPEFDYANQAELSLYARNMCGELARRKIDLLYGPTDDQLLLSIIEYYIDMAFPEEN